MRKFFIFNRQRFGEYLFYFLLLSLIFLLSGCGGGSDDNFSSQPSETGSATFTVAWESAPVIKASENALVATQADDVCVDVQKIICEVYEVNDDGSRTYLTTGGPWDCSAHSGTINGIVAGKNREFVILAEDTGGNILYHGVTPNITITPDQTTDVGTIESFSFVPTLLSPPDNSEVALDALLLDWTPVENAYEYRVQVSKDINFDAPVIDETTTSIPYTPSGLIASTTYYWKVFARDIQGNQGIGSQEVWSFTTAEAGTCTYIISPGSRTVPPNADSFSFSVTTPSGCAWNAFASEDWINITSGSTGIGNGTVTYAVSANDTSSTRTGTITVADQIHTVSQNPDTTSPTVAISSPTSDPTYSTTSSTLYISGTASDDMGVTQVTWTNRGHGSGACSGTSTWRSSGIDLFDGQNVIIVTAMDGAGNTGTAVLTVTRLVPGPPVISLDPDLGKTYIVEGGKCLDSSGNPTGATQWYATIDYTDPDGDVTEGAAKVFLIPFCSIPPCSPPVDVTFASFFNENDTDTGFKGSFGLAICSTGKVTIELEDGSGQISNQLGVTMPSD